MLILTILGAIIHLNIKNRVLPSPAPHICKYAALTASLQPNKRNLNVLVFSDIPEIAEEFRHNPIVKNIESNNIENETSSIYDLIFISLPNPETIAASPYYSDQFWNRIKNMIEPDGCVAVYLPQNRIYPDAPLAAKAVYSLTKYLLDNSFISVKPAPGIQYLFLCGEQNITVLPSELDQRLEILIRDEFKYPKGIFRLQTSEQEFANQYYKHQHSGENVILSSSPCPALQKIWFCERLPYSWVKKYLEYPGYLFCCIFWFCIGIYLIRRYLSEGNKESIFHFENGIFLGIIMMLTVIGCKNYSNWYISCTFLIGILIGDFCKHKNMIPCFWSSIAGILALLLVFWAQADGLIYLPAAFAGGFSFGFISPSDNDRKATSFYGISAGLLTASVLYFMNGGICSAIIIASLTRIPALVDKKIKK